MSAGSSKEPMNEQVIANMYSSMHSEVNQIHSKITELEIEVSEHSLVLAAIKPLDQSRRCYRMIGGVLVERTIKEVLPAVDLNKQGLEEVINRLNEALERKKKEISEFELKYKIKMKRGGEALSKEEEAAEQKGTSQGVLVGPAGEQQT
ncbi:Prefoldin subunit 2 [Zostera marina]|uniref:Prefoldin subunit 2 n=1 Tax=Zostera marina TaxID=29655 RepID=A0A0K9NI63_ZOSMR|nr:Prefoldin subunit 2 [Zostera marina]